MHKEMITFQELLQVMNGVDKNKNSLTAATLIEERPLKNQKALETVRSINFDYGVFNINASGGCIVVDVTFPKKMLYVYNQIMQECSQWFANIDNPAFDDRVLRLTLIPIILEGQITVLLDNLVYFFGVKFDDCEKVILCFDNTKTSLYQSEGLNLSQIKADIDKEIKRQEEELDKKLEEVEKEIKDIENKQALDANIVKNIENPAADLMSTDALYDNQSEEEETEDTPDEDDFLNDGYFDDDYESQEAYSGIKTSKDNSNIQVDDSGNFGIRISRSEDDE